MAITVYICCSRLSKLISHATLCLLSSSPYFGVCGPEVLLPFRLPEVYFGPLRSLPGLRAATQGMQQPCKLEHGQSIPARARARARVCVGGFFKCHFPFFWSA